MAKRFVWNSTTKKMEEVSNAQKGDTIKVSLPIELFEKLKSFAIEDGYNFAGVSYETEKDKEGKTKHDKEGNIIFKLDKDGKKIIRTVKQSQGKINSAVAEYVKVAVGIFTSDRLALK